MSFLIEKAIFNKENLGTLNEHLQFIGASVVVVNSLSQEKWPLPKKSISLFLYNTTKFFFWILMMLVRARASFQLTSRFPVKITKPLNSSHCRSRTQILYSFILFSTLDHLSHRHCPASNPI